MTQPPVSPGQEPGQPTPWNSAPGFGPTPYAVPGSQPPSNMVPGHPPLPAGSPGGPPPGNLPAGPAPTGRDILRMGLWNYISNRWAPENAPARLVLQIGILVACFLVFAMLLMVTRG
jgi:hypothetical protein